MSRALGQAHGLRSQRPGAMLGGSGGGELRWWSQSGLVVKADLPLSSVLIISEVHGGMTWTQRTCTDSSSPLFPTPSSQDSWVMSQRRPFWLMRAGKGWMEGGPLAHRLGGKAGGPGLLWGAEPVYGLLTVNGTKSPGRVAHLVSSIWPLAREGLVSGHLVPPTAPAREEMAL